MPAKQFYLIIDCESSIKGHCSDFGAIVVDRIGNLYESCAVLVHDFKNEELFHDPKAVAGSLWCRQNLENRRLNYQKMLENGTRHYASVNAINIFLDKVIAKYGNNISLTAYNVAFDAQCCAKSKIDLSKFTKRFCLWYLACAIHASTKKYRQFVLDNHYFGNRTVKSKSITYWTNAEVMAHYVQGFYSEEPHTAYEDCLSYEIPILLNCLKHKNWCKFLDIPYNYRNYQLKDNFVAK